MKVVAFESVQNIPKHSDKRIDDLLPKKVFTTSCRLTLDGVSNAVANGLRRAIVAEIPVKVMLAGEIETDDAFIISEMIVERIKMIPIMQNTPVNTKFRLAVKCGGSDRTVYSGEIQNVSKGDLPFEKNFPLFDLNPGKSLLIDEISIMEECAYQPGCGMMLVASGGAAVCLDVQPLDAEAGTGESTSTADGRKWLVSFRGHGTMSDKDIIIAACNSIISRVEAVKEVISTITSNGREHSLVINGESSTIGNLFMRTVLDLNPKGVSIVFDANQIMMRVCVLRILCDGDVATILHSAADEIIEIYKDIISGVKKAK